MKARFYFLLIFPLLLAFAGSRVNRVPVYAEAPTPIADSLIATMTLDEKIGQLFMVAAYSNKDEIHCAEIESLVRNEKIGGLIFFQGGPGRQCKLTNRYQQAAQVPLLIAMDAEWGLAMRLDSTIAYPRQMALGAISNDSLIYQYGLEMARQCQRMGVHVSFSPVVDVNSNPNNPVIGNRAFGQDKYNVTRKSMMYMKGLQDGRVLANAKHFPGHGDTDADSHHDLPIINHNRERMDTLELYPFQQLINQGLGSVMVAHLHIPVYDSRDNIASTLSPEVVTNLLRDQLGFKGLAFTDALNMKGVSKYWKPGELEVNALLAGNDVLLFPENVPVAIAGIKTAIETGQLKEADITARCHQILKTKEWTGALKRERVNPKNLRTNLNDQQAREMKQRLVEASLTVIRNDTVLPLRQQEGKRMAILNVGSKGAGRAFNEAMAAFFTFDSYEMDNSPDFEASKQTVDNLANYDLVVMNLMSTGNSVKKNYGVTNVSIRVANTISAKTKLVLNVFANPYSLRKMIGVEKSHGITIAYHDDEMTHKAVAALMAGTISASGKLPADIENKWKTGHGLEVRPGGGTTEAPKASPYGFNSSLFARVDSLAMSGIKAKAYPGCQVAVLFDGQLVYDKSFGHLTYDKTTAVTSETVYDLASITKIAASTALVMHYHERGLINVDYNLCDYMDVCDTTAYFHMNIREMMSHYAKLKDWIPFYTETMEKGNHKSDLYRKRPETGYSTMVAPGLYIKDGQRQDMLDRIMRTQLRDKLEYKYSDLGYYFLQEILERKTGRSIAFLADSLFYSPLGLKRTTYNPVEKGISLNEIAPTEDDRTFRKQLVHGYVHDQGAAMLGGVAGHAGLFSTARELATIMQMLSNGGTFNGRRYITEDVLEYFTTCHYCDGNNRRGIGFDKPTQGKSGGSTCASAAFSSFGHTGFTGTIAWADPENGIVFVFLSNRVYPDADNQKLLNMGIRTDIQQVLYDIRKVPSRFAK